MTGYDGIVNTCIKPYVKLVFRQVKNFCLVILFRQNCAT